jgi:hypothetical protein
MKNEKKSRGVSEMLQGALDGIEQGVEALHEQHPWLQQMSEQVADVYTKTRNNISHTSAYIQDFMGLKKIEMQQARTNIENLIDRTNIPEEIKNRAKTLLTITPTGILVGCGSGSNGDEEACKAMGIDCMDGPSTISENIGSLLNGVGEEAFIVLALLAIGAAYKSLPVNRDRAGEGMRWNDGFEGAFNFLAGGEALRGGLEYFWNAAPGPGTTTAIALGAAGAFTTWRWLKDR